MIYDPVEKLPESDILKKSENSLMYLGRSFSNINPDIGREIWLNRDDMTRHLLISGSTGSGKTELLLGMCAGSIAAGDGLLFVDGKGDISTFAKINALASRAGRRDDVLLLNFAQGIPVERKKGGMLSHTINPFRSLSSDAIVQILTTLMDGVNAEDAMWRGRAIAMLTGVVRVATWLRDYQGIPLTISALRNMCHLSTIVELASTAAYPDMPASIQNVIHAYLNSLPGYSAAKGKTQAQTTLDQHGYLEMQTTRMFSSLADVYGHIFNEESSDISMRDVVLNRRILVVLLPVLEKSSDEVANLGRIIVSLLKNTMAEAMACPVEGDWNTVVENRPTNAGYPFLTIMDEVSHYLTDGMAMMAGQARSLGFCLVFAVQDIATMMERSRRESTAILANTNTKIFMSTQNPDDFSLNGLLPSGDKYTGRNFPERFPETLIRYMGFREERFAENNAEKIDEQYRAMMSMMEGQPVWSLRDTMKSLKPGEYIAVRQGEFLRGRSMWVSPSVEHVPVTLNRFVPIPADDTEITEYHNREALKAEFIALLSSNPAAALGVQPLGFHFASDTGDSSKAKSAVRRSFAAVATYGTPIVSAASSELFTIED